MNDAEKLQWLVDRAEIGELLYTYAVSTDSLDEALFRSIWTDEVTVNSVGGPFEGQDMLSTLSADKWASVLMKRLRAYSVTQHVMTNPKIRVHGDVADTNVYMRCCLFPKDWKPGDPYIDTGGYYTHHVVRTPAGWRIQSYCWHVTWWTQASTSPATRTS